MDNKNTSKTGKPLFSVLKLHNIKLQIVLVITAYLLQGIYYLRFDRPVEIYLTSLGIGIPYFLLVILLSYTCRYSIVEATRLFGRELFNLDDEGVEGGKMQLLFQNRDRYEEYQQKVVSRVYGRWRLSNIIVILVAPALIVAIFGGQFSPGYDVTSGEVPYQISVNEFLLDPVFLTRNLFWIIWSYYLTITTFTWVIFLLKVVFIAFNLNKDQGLVTNIDTEYPDDISEFVELEYKELVNRRSIENFRSDAKMITQYMLRISLIGLIMNVLLAITIIVFIVLTDISDSLFGLGLIIYFPSYLLIILGLFFFPQIKLKTLLENAKNRHLSSLKMAYAQNFGAFIKFDSIDDKATYLDMYKKLNEMIEKTRDLDIWPATVRQWVALLGVAIGPIKPIFDFVDFIELWELIQSFLPN